MSGLTTEILPLAWKQKACFRPTGGSQKMILPVQHREPHEVPKYLTDEVYLGAVGDDAAFVAHLE